MNSGINTYRANHAGANHHSHHHSPVDPALAHLPPAPHPLLRDRPAIGGLRRRVGTEPAHDKHAAANAHIQPRAAQPFRRECRDGGQER
jgi:hypothetical protein